MPVGKLSAQAGHAYTDALCESMQQTPEKFHNYRMNNNGGSKVTLYCKNESQLIATYHEIKSLGIPCSIVVDREHILPPHFDGSPIITALGIGPCTKPETAHILKKFRCV